MKTLTTTLRKQPVLLTVPVLVGGLLLACLLPAPIAAGCAIGTALLVTGGLCWHLGQSAARRRSDHFVQNLIDAIPEPIYIKDRDARFVWVNEAFAQERRRPKPELIGLSSYDLSPNAQFSATLAGEDKTVLAGGSIDKEQHTTYPVTGEECFRLVSKRLCQDISGAPLIIGAHFDITRIRQAEAAQQETLAREIAQRQRIQTYMQRLIDVIPQPVYVKDAASRYLMVNEAFCKHRQVCAKELIGKDPFDLTGNAEHSRRVMAEDREVLDGQVISKEECMKHPVTGEEVFRFICKGACDDADGQPVIVGANFDITAWRLAELRWKHASQAKSQFLATMSHEIRTPLSGVIGMLQLALKDPVVADEPRNRLETALGSAESLLGIINDILDFSKIEAGQLQLEKMDLDLHTITRDAFNTFADQAQQRGLGFTLDIDPQTPRYLRGDPTRIRQILINLVGNALKFTERGHIAIRLYARPAHNDVQHVAISVTDTGIGIPAEVIPTLFQIFQQGDVSTTRRFGGTGLGLAICRQLVNAMGGDIAVTSSLGQGSCFEFDLLLEAGQPPVTKEAEPLPPHRHKLRVLCAEDVRVNQLILKAQLSHLGHEADIVSNGLAAIQALAEKDYDLVLMDGRMPEMDGTDATRAIRAGGLPEWRVRNPSIRIIALTANASNEDREQSLAAGMDDYLTKPVREAQLHTILSGTIDLLEQNGEIPRQRTAT